MTEQLEVVELVATSVDERDPVVHLEAVGGAAADTDTIAYTYCVTTLAPVPSASDTPAGSPAAAPAVAACREGAAVEAGSG
jgi:hypothetical protein